jgi:hypothetical protein
MAKLLERMRLDLRDGIYNETVNGICEQSENEN